MSASTSGGNLRADSLRTGLVAWWGCHEDLAQSRLEATGSGNNLLDSGAAAVTAGNVPSSPGLMGNAASFSGSNTPYLLLLANLIPSGNFTMSCWVFPAQVPATTVNPCGQGAGTGIRLTLTATNAFFQFSTGNITYVFLDNFVRVWTHLCGTFDGTTARLYVNGVLVGTSTPTVVYTGNFAVGRRGDGSAATGFNGLVQGVGLWSRALSDGGVSPSQLASGEVMTLYNSRRGSDYPFQVVA